MGSTTQNIPFNLLRTRTQQVMIVTVIIVAEIPHVFFVMEHSLDKLSFGKTSSMTHIDIIYTVTGLPTEGGSQFPANDSRGPKGFLDLPGGKST